MATYPPQTLTIEFADLTALQATTRPYLKLNGVDSQYAITNTFDADVTAVAGPSSAGIVPSRTNDLIRTLITTGTPGPSGEIVFLDSTGPDVINNDWSTTTQTLLRISKQNSDGNSDLALLFFQSEQSDTTKPMIFSNGSSADPMSYLFFQFNGAWSDGGDYWVVPIAVNSGAGTPATTDKVLWGVTPRNRFTELRDVDTLVDDRVLYRDGNTQLVTNILGTGNPKYAEVTYSLSPSVTVTACTQNVWVKLAGATTFSTPNVGSPIFDNGVSGPGAASNRISVTANSQAPFTHYRIHAVVSVLCTSNDRTFLFAISRNGNPIIKTIQSDSAHSDREDCLSLDLLIDAPLPPNDYFEVYVQNIENNDDLTGKYLYFTATPMV